MSMVNPFQDEKRWAASSSVGVALFLTAIKLVVGLLTRSLGIISEAAHSGLDLVAALMTWFAVRYSGKPADTEHPYGHQKFENASALFETLLLVVTCVWIIYKAVDRLFFRSVAVDVNVWSYAVVITAIVLDWSRSRMLYRVAKKTHSQALEADALHFSTDIYSSLVVLAGLVFTRVGLQKADAVAAMGVAVFVMAISFRLGWRSMSTLMDRVPADHVPKAIAAAMRVPEISRAYDVRVREAGDRHFIDMKVTFDPSVPFRVAHSLTEAVEKAVKAEFLNADVVVHAEPGGRTTGFLPEKVAAVAEDHGAQVHDLTIREADGGWSLALHLSWPHEISLHDAHDRATEIETALKNIFPGLASVRSHLESSVEWAGGQRDITAEQQAFVDTLRSMTLREDGVRSCADIRILEEKGLWRVTLICTVDPELSLHEAHRIASRIEQGLRQLDRRIASVDVHTEPHESPSTAAS